HQGPERIAKLLDGIATGILRAARIEGVANPEHQSQVKGGQERTHKTMEARGACGCGAGPVRAPSAPPSPSPPWPILSPLFACLRSLFPFILGKDGVEGMAQAPCLGAGVAEPGALLECFTETLARGFLSANGAEDHPGDSGIHLVAAAGISVVVDRGADFDRP